VTSIEPRELAAALRQAGLADVDAGTRRRAEYSTDASNYRVVPAVVAFPRHVDEAEAALGVAREFGVPFTSRGGGTSIAGNSVGSGIVLDFSRHLNRVTALDPEARTAVAEPGTILDAITIAAAPHGLRFGPDPSTHARASIGGSLGNNACGSRALAYGRTADNVVELDLLTGRGVRFTARRYGRDGLSADGPESALLAALGGIVGERLGLIRTEFGRFTRQVSGYSMEHLLPENSADLAKFLVGTEGTLGVILGATVRLVESPPAVALAVLGYPDMPTAADAVPALLPHRPLALEGMDARLVGVVRARRGSAAVPDLPRGEGWLFVETSGATEAEARVAAEELIADAGCLDSAVVTGAPARALWRIREDGAGLGGRTPAGAPAWPGWEDAAVPPAQLGAYLREFGALMREQGVDGVIYRALRRRLRARAHRLPAEHRARAVPRVRRGRGTARRPARRFDVRRARRRSRPRRVAALHVLTRGDRHLRRDQARLRSDQRPQSRRDRRPGTARRRPADPRGETAAHQPRLRLPPRRRRPFGRGAPVRRDR